MSRTSDREFVRVKGRGYYDDTNLRLSWSASGYSVRFYGTELKAVMTAEGISGVLNIYTDRNSNQYYFNTDASDYSAERVAYNARCPHINLSDGQKTYTVVSGLEEGIHTVTLLKRGEIIRSSNIYLSGLSTDGYFCDPPAESPRKIEIVGDSNATGFGNLASGSGDYVWDQQDATLTFGAYCAEALSADYSLCARSGASVTPTYGETDDAYMVDTYLMKDRWHGFTEDYDFGSGSDVVIVHLGDNDRDHGAGSDNYIMWLAHLLSQIRHRNRNATIICVLSLCVGYDDWYGYVQQAIDRAKSEHGVTNVYKYLVDRADSNNGAPAGHALQKYHKILGKNLADYIRTLKGWDRNVYEAVEDNTDSNVVIDLSKSYYKPGETVSFSASVTTGVGSISSVSVKKIGTEYGQSVAVTGSGGNYSFTMPSDRVLVSAKATIRLMCGDINFDNKSNAVDALYAMRYSVDLITLSDLQLKSGDVDNSSSVTLVDALVILQYSVKKISSFPAGEYVYV